jgi:hypothetical protein
MGLSLHQLHESRWVYGVPMRGERRDKTAPIVVPQVVGVVVGFSQVDANFCQGLTETGKMEWLGVRDHPIEVKDNCSE